jgi:acyl dehydratase
VNPVNYDVAAARSAGYPDLVAPPTFAVVVQESSLQRLLAEPGAGIDLAHVLHGEQRFHQVRPIVAGDELTAQLTVTGLRALAGNTMLTAETRIADAGGAEVVTATSVLVVHSDPEPSPASGEVEDTSVVGR